MRAERGDERNSGAVGAGRQKNRRKQYAACPNGVPAKASFSFRGERRDKEAQCGIPKGCSTWSGLCLDDEQLTEVYRCIAETLDSGYPITREREKTLATTMEQISASVDNLDERVSLSNQRELEAMEQHGPEMPEDIHNQGGMRFE